MRPWQAGALVRGGRDVTAWNSGVPDQLAELLGDGVVAIRVEFRDELHY